MIRTIHGLDWGATSALASLDLMSGEMCNLETIVKRDSAKYKPATKKREAIPALDLWETWAIYSGQLLDLLLTVRPGDIIALEDPGAHMRRDGWLSHGRARCIAEMAAHQRGCTLVCVPTGRVKQTATGHGRAEKEEMIKAAEKRWPSVSSWTEHEADAAWIAETARLGRE
jgi:Holliday junction resolvasome RuvABC endonuclease subunit